ncbi:unnamed protein product [Adineta steineri]|uniref:Uncharacterized protein n=1 Tax=Adineta steineri TaxID=433720 RepID=A0A813PQ52_9BILA|nr:unnamed protein product [Adineta steineri]CAF0865832.1 unnamed protein product [Adineta steineri]
MVAIEKQHFIKPWMTSDKIPMIKPHFSDGYLPPLKSIGEHENTDKQMLQIQPKLHNPLLFPPTARSTTSKSGITDRSMESPSSPLVNSSPIRETDYRSVLRNSLSSIVTSRSPSVHTESSIRPKRTSLYDYIRPKINTGLMPRIESSIRRENNTHQLGPSRPLKWNLLRQGLEQDIEIRAQTKRLQFNSGITYTQQLKKLGDLIRSKAKSHVSLMTNQIEERYKIVVQLTVFQTKTGGLHVSSRCLWNSQTDNSITFKMYGVDYINDKAVVFFASRICHLVVRHQNPVELNRFPSLRSLTSKLPQNRQLCGVKSKHSPNSTHTSTLYFIKFLFKFEAFAIPSKPAQHLLVKRRNVPFIRDDPDWTKNLINYYHYYRILNNYSLIHALGIPVKWNNV